MPLDAKSFALHEYRRKNFDKEVWVPLRAAVTQNVGRFGFEGYLSSFFGATSVAVPLRKIEVAKSQLNWHSIGLMRDHNGYVQGSTYYPADLFVGDGFKGVNLLIAQRSSNGEAATWHLHPDLLTTLNLRREGNSWLATEEGYLEVVRLRQKLDGTPQIIEIRAEFLKDYLCARKMALCVSFYAEKDEIFSQLDGADWNDFDAGEVSQMDVSVQADEHQFRRWEKTLADGRWQGSVTPLHEGGNPIGSGFAVLHVGRKNFDRDQSVPTISPLDEMETKSHTGQYSGPVVYRVWGEIWRDVWVNPASISVRVRQDEPPPTCFYIIDAEGTRAANDQLRDSGRWLWFNPSVIGESLGYRGASLQWHTRETGTVSMARDGGVHFGVNDLGLVNVYAKDVAFMPVWQQRIWAGFNVPPDGGVSKELLSAQAEGIPARTQAPEEFLLSGRNELDKTFESIFGCKVFRRHADVDRISASCHRFRAVDREGLFELAKDLARITADDIDVKGLQKVVAPPEGEKRGSLKSLEAVIASKTGNDRARVMMKALFAIYELRLADAHLESSETLQSLQKLRIDPKLPYVLQGRDMLVALVSTLYGIAGILSKTRHA